MVKSAMQYACGRLHGQAWAGKPCHMHPSRGFDQVQHGHAMRRTRRPAQVQELAQEAAHCWPGAGVVFEPIQLRENRASDHQEHLAADVGGAGFTWMSVCSVLLRRPSQERLPTAATCT